MIHRGWLPTACLVLSACVARAQAPPSYDFDWATITHAGNRAATQEEAPYLFPPFSTPELHLGSVPYEYRISRTELTVEQHFEFVQAYAPFWKGNPGASEFIGVWISWNGSGYAIDPGYEKKAASMGWRTAARYCNWLHNGKVNEPWAFEDGAYDTSTFGTNPDGTLTDQPAHHPDARFWIPTHNEWAKAAHYDPNRYGEGLEGYWLYPDAGQEPLISGYPWEGGETDAGIEIKPGYTYLDVGSYPDVRSPWGLLDLSGGRREWCEDLTANGLHRIYRGSGIFQPSPDVLDRVDSYSAWVPTSSGQGFRLASQVPAPSACLVLPSLILLRRRSRSTFIERNFS